MILMRLNLMCVNVHQRAQRFLHLWLRCLCEQDAEALLERDTLARVFVVRREASRVRRDGRRAIWTCALKNK